MGPSVRFDEAVSEPSRLLLSVAQTSGGLFLCVPAASADALCARLRGEGGVACVIAAI